MPDFAAMLAEARAADVWREANPGPLIWVTSVRPGMLLRQFTSDQLDLPVRPTTYCYIGRAMPGIGGYTEASELGNPFRPGDATPEAREACIARYAGWLAERFHPETAQWRELGKILGYALERNGIALGCWCAPKSCHGSVVRAAVLQMYAAGWRPEHFQ